MSNQVKVMTCHEGQQNHVYRHCDKEFMEKEHINSQGVTTKMVMWVNYNLHGDLGKNYPKDGPTAA